MSISSSNGWMGCKVHTNSAGYNNKPKAIKRAFPRRKCQQSAYVKCFLLLLLIYRKHDKWHALCNLETLHLFGTLTTCPSQSIHSKRSHFSISSSKNCSFSCSNIQSSCCNQEQNLLCGCCFAAAKKKQS